MSRFVRSSLLFAFGLGSMSLLAVPVSATPSEEYMEKELGSVDPPMPQAFPTFSNAHRQFNGPFVIRQVNVNSSGLNIVNDAANEPSITVNPANPNQIVIGWRQFDNKTSNFRQAGYGFSADGGVTWTASKLTPGLFRSDPVLAASSTGIIHYNSLQNTFYSDQFLSSTGGSTWGSANFATGGDKQWMVVDPANPSAVYQAWSRAGNNYSGRQFSRSLNGGITWADPVNIPSQPYWGTLDTDALGRVYLGGSDGGSTMILARSSNASNSGQTPTFALVTNPNMGGQIDAFATVNPGGLSGQMSVCVDKSNGSTRNNVYMLSTLNTGTSNSLDVMFVRSQDGGSTWSTAKRVNDDPTGTGRQQWFGALACAPNGRLDAVWLDTRNDPTSNIRSALYRSYSLDGGLTWSANEKVTETFDPRVGYPNQNKIGDYLGVVSTATGAHVAFPGTFNNEQDVYYVFLDAPPIPVTGTVSYGAYTPDLASRTLQLQLRRNSDNSVLQSQTVTATAAGTFVATLDPSLVHANPGVHWWVKVDHWLADSVISASLPLTGVSGLSFTLRTGDCNGDNVVNLFDYFVLSNAYDSDLGDPAYLAGADLNDDNTVNFFDYLALSDFYEQAGEE